MQFDDVVISDMIDNIAFRTSEHVDKISVGQCGGRTGGQFYFVEFDIFKSSILEIEKVK